MLLPHTVRKKRARSKTHAGAADFLSYKLPAPARRLQVERGRIDTYTKRLSRETKKPSDAQRKPEAQPRTQSLVLYNSRSRVLFPPLGFRSRGGRRQTRAKRSFSTPLNIDAPSRRFFSSLRKKLQGKEVNRRRRRSCVFDTHIYTYKLVFK